MSRSPISPDAAREQEWERLSAILDQFCARWEAGPSPPDLAEFTHGLSPELKAIALKELVKLDMEFRSRERSSWRPLEHYFQQWPELLIDGLPPSDLIFEEFRIRKMAGDDVHTAQYQERFPEAFQSLTRLVSTDESRRNRKAAPRASIRQFRAGDRIDDFDLLTRLGKGGFATVFLARQNSMQRLVALKISVDQGFEHQTLAQLDHPHIVRVYDHRVIENPPVRLMYMQYIAGGTLQEIAREASSLAAGEPLAGRHFVAALDAVLSLRGETGSTGADHRRRLQAATWSSVVSHIGSEIAEALDYAHEHDVLHRDLKPANVLIDKDGHARLVDFNISFCAKVDGAAPKAWFGGSLAYMSPEQLEACSPDHDRSPADLDGRSDIFSLGIILFELAAGERPFGERLEAGNWGQTMEETIRGRRSGQAALDDLLAKGKDISPFLVRAIRRALAPEPVQRFARAGDMIRHLELASNEKALVALQPPQNVLSRLARRSVFLAAGLLTLGLSAAGALFIFSYNLEKSAPPAGSRFFREVVVPGGNLVLFTLGGVLVVQFTRRLRRVIREHAGKVPIPREELRRAIVDNFYLGHRCALMSVSEWTFAGICYPLVLTLAGYPLAGQGWADFIGSHFLAGLIAGAYLFWLLAWCSLHVWQPVLLEASLDNDETTDWTPAFEKLERFCSVYHVLALAIPPIAIIWLVVYHESRDRFALTVVSLVSVMGLVLLSWASRGVLRQLAILKSLFVRASA